MDGREAMARNVMKVLLAALLVTGAPAAAQMGVPGPGNPMAQTVDPSVKTSFVRLAGGVPGVLYEPVASGPKARIAVFAMHASGDYLAFSACNQLAKRGYKVLCANNSTSKSGAFDEACSTALSAPSSNPASTISANAATSIRSSCSATAAARRSCRRTR
jgi:hypothetical protein